MRRSLKYSTLSNSFIVRYKINLLNKDLPTYICTYIRISIKQNFSNINAQIN